MLAGAMLERFRGDRILVALGLIRAVAAALTAATIATAGPTMDDHQVTLVLLFVLAAVAAAAGAPVRPTQVTLMPALARSPGELVAANTAWSTGEGLGAFGGPFVAGAADGGRAARRRRRRCRRRLPRDGRRRRPVSGSSRRPTRRAAAAARPAGLRLTDGMRAVRRRPVLAWSMLGYVRPGR